MKAAVFPRGFEFCDAGRNEQHRVEVGRCFEQRFKRNWLRCLSFWTPPHNRPQLFTGCRNAWFGDTTRRAFGLELFFELVIPFERPVEGVCSPQLKDVSFTVWPSSSHSARPSHSEAMFLPCDRGAVVPKPRTIVDIGEFPLEPCLRTRSHNPIRDLTID